MVLLLLWHLFLFHHTYQVLTSPSNFKCAVKEVGRASLCFDFCFCLKAHSLEVITQFSYDTDSVSITFRTVHLTSELSLSGWWSVLCSPGWGKKKGRLWRQCLPLLVISWHCSNCCIHLCIYGTSLPNVSETTCSYVVRAAEIIGTVTTLSSLRLGSGCHTARCLHHDSGFWVHSQLTCGCAAESWSGSEGSVNACADCTCRWHLAEQLQ